MADNLSFNAEIKLEVDRALRDLNRLITNMGDLQGRSDMTSQALQRIERTASQLAQAMGNVSRAVGNGTTSLSAQNRQLSAQQQTLAGLVSQYNALRAAQQSQGTAGQPGSLAALNSQVAARVRLENDHGAAIAENTRRLAAQNNEHMSGLASTRYALYDVSRTWAAISVATLGAATAAVAVAASYESVLAQVERTSQTSGAIFDTLSRDLVEISTLMPVAFADVGQIATLAGQLGVASESIASFTQTVVRFAATTDVTAEAAATGIGRVAQLTGTSAAEYENLAAAIYQTGITSVATESQILRTATQISTAGDLAGFANTEIVALASAFASLNIAPERARGSTQRIFGQLDVAVQEGGELLESFAQLSAMSAQEFAAAWTTDPQVAFSAFVEGLGAAGKAGEDTNAMLKDMGIGAVRDIQALQALGNNYEVYAQALDETSQAYADGTAVINGYGIIAETLTAKLQLLKNTVMAMMASIGDSKAVKIAADLLLALAGAAERFFNSWAGNAIGKGMLAIGALVGVFAAIQAAIALTRASVLGLLQVQSAMSRTTLGNVMSLGGLTRALGQVSGVTNAYTAATGRATAASAAYTATVNGQAGALVRLRGAQAAAATGMAGMAGRFAGFAKAGLIGVGIFAAIEGINQLGKAFESAESKAARLFNGGEGLAEALKQDTAAYKEMGTEAEGFITRFTVSHEESARVLNEHGEALGNALGGQASLGDATAETTTHTESQSIAVGKLTRDWAINALTTGEAGDKMVEWFQKYNSTVSQVEGFDLSSLFTEALNPKGNVEAEFDAMIARLNDKMATLRPNWGAFGKENNADATEYKSIQKQIEGIESLRDRFSLLGTQIDTTATKMSISDSITAGMTGSMDMATESVDGMAAETESLANAMDSYVESAFGTIDATAAVEESLFSLGESLRDNGNSFNTYTEGGRANMDALRETINAMAIEANGDTETFAQSLMGLMTQLSAYGVDAQSELGVVQDLLAQLGHTTATAVADVDTSAAEAKLANLSANMRALIGATPKGGGFAARVGQQLVSPLRKQLGATINNTVKEINKVKKPTYEVAKAGRDLGSSMGQGFDKASRAAEKAGKKSKDAADKAAKGAKDVKQEIVTLVDYASDLGSVMSRAFELRFSVSQGEDSIASQYESIRESAESAAKAIDDANQKIREIDAALGTLRASNKTLEYQLRVAVEYGDTLRASEIRAKLGENNAEISGLNGDRTDATRSLTAAQDKASTSLTGNTAGARANREAVLSLVQSYQKQIQALASSGLSTDQLAVKTEELRRDFVNQLTQMGYNRNEVERYARSFDDMSAAIARVPRMITVDANADPAQQAINEFMARNSNLSLSANLSASGGGVYNASGIAVGGGGISTPNIVGARIGVGVGGIVTPKLSADVILKTGIGIGGAMGAGYSKGGFTGRGGKEEPAGVVHKGEYVVPKEGVNQSTGLPYQSYLGNMLPAQSISNTTVNNNSRSSAQAIQLVELLPTQINQLANAILSAPAPVISAAAIAGAANSANKQANVRSNA